MKDVPSYDLFGGIALKNHAFSFFSFQSCVIIFSAVRSTFSLKDHHGFLDINLNIGMFV